MNSRKITTLIIIAGLAASALYSLGDSHLDIDGEQIDGPLAAVLGLLLAGGGLLLGAVAVLGSALLVGLLFAGLGVLMLSLLVLLAAVVCACIAPFLLPLLIGLALFWWCGRRRQQALKQLPV